MSPASFKIAIIGQGAIGSLLAYKCHQLHYDYELLLRTKTFLSINVESLQGDCYAINVPSSPIATPSEFDILIVPTKAYQVISVLNDLRHYIKPKHVIVLLHNGMGSIEQVRTIYPNNPLIAATTSYGAYKPNTHNLKETGSGETHLGWLNSCNSDLRQNIETVLSNLLPPSTWHSDITKALWNKLAINAAINPLTAIKNIKNGKLAEKQYQKEIKTICTEVSEVMSAMGYSTTAGELHVKVIKVIKATADNYSSMHQDLAFKRKTEINFINGYIVKTAEASGIKTPKNLTLLQEIEARENKFFDSNRTLQ